MAEPVKGQLVWQGDGDKRIRKVTFPTKKGTSQPTHFDADQLAVSLKNCKEDRVDVDLEVVAGKPVRIRPVGEPFTAPPQQLPVRSPQHHGGSQFRGQLNAGSQGQTQHQIVPIKGVFHNPYNFVPAPQRNSITGELGDHAPVGHHVLHPDHYTGVIRVKMTVKTPLLLPDAANAKDVDNDHKSFPVRVDTAGKPYIPPTSIKGMLRTAYEAITNSRLAVFGGQEANSTQNSTGHGMRLAFRRPARVEVVPARIEVSNDQQLTIRLLSKLWLKSPAKLPRYFQRFNKQQKNRKGEDTAALHYPDHSLPQHGDHVRVIVGGNGKISKIVRFDSSMPSDGDEGWVLITEPNINNKKFERVYVVSSKDNLLSLQGLKAIRVQRMWTELISNYQQTHTKELEQRKKLGQLPTDYLGDTPGQTAWSRQVWDKHYTTLQEGTLCYVRVSGKLNEIEGIYPVSISRDLFSVSPLSLLPESLRPATSLPQLSPADRIFGWVNQRGKGACKGNVRIGPVKCEMSNAIENFKQPGLPLAILGQPKPQQAAFYVAASINGEAQSHGLGKEQAGYLPHKGLRGRKVYPHHNGLPTPHWIGAIQDRTQFPVNGHFQEYRRPKLHDLEQRDTKNRSILGWVKPDKEFTFDIHVTNLSKVELGALLWLLNLPEECFHRFGGGKPLGFGSVRLEIVSSSLHDGNGWKQFYSDLSGEMPKPSDNNALIKAFQESVATAYGQGLSFENVSFIVAWLKSASGHSDNLPTHYPRVRQQNGPVPPHREGKSFEWFVQNENPNNTRASLPDLKNDTGLPIY